MSPATSSVVRKSITIPVGIYEKIEKFRKSQEIFSHFCSRIFDLFLERSNIAEVERIGIAKEIFHKLIEQYPKEKTVELVKSLENCLEITVGKKLQRMTVEDITQCLTRILVDINNIFTTLTFNFLDGQNLQMIVTHKSTESYADFWAEYLKQFFGNRGYNVIEQEIKKGYLYIHFQSRKRRGEERRG